jgi:hypothetical protein
VKEAVGVAVKEAVQAVPTELLTNPAVLAKLGGETFASLPCHARKAVSGPLVGVIITRTRVVRRLGEPAGRGRIGRLFGQHGPNSLADDAGDGLADRGGHGVTQAYRRH